MNATGATRPTLVVAVRFSSGSSCARKSETGSPLEDEAVDEQPRVVVVGAGFAGLASVRALAGAPVRVTVVDTRNHHTFQALLYQVATAGLDPGAIAASVRGVTRSFPNVEFRVATVVGVDLVGRELLLEDGTRLTYDFVVLAAGGVTDYFGVPGAAERAFPIKTLEDAVRIRSHVLEAFEQAAVDRGLIESGALDVVIVGGGPTGVELAGAFTELFSMVLARDFPGLDVRRARVILLEAGPSLLRDFHPRSQRCALETLRSRGVVVRLGAAVSRVTAEGVELADGSFLRTRTVIWSAGVRANPLTDAVGCERARAGRVVTTDDLSVPGHPEVFVAGDLAHATDASGRPYPQMAPFAIESGRHAAEQIRRIVAGEATRPFVYRNRSVMATIGRDAAVAELPLGLRFRGRVAWLLWLSLHLVRIIGFRNRLRVLLEWSWSYLTYDRGARLIVPPERASAHRAGTASFVPSNQAYASVTGRRPGNPAAQSSGVR